MLLLVYIIAYLPQGSVTVDATYAQIGKDLEEVSSVSGASPGTTFRRILLPLMIPGLMVGWAMLFVRMSGDLTASVMLSGAPNPVIGFRILDIYNNGSSALLASLALVITVLNAAVIAVVFGLGNLFGRRKRVGVGRVARS